MEARRPPAGGGNEAVPSEARVVIIGGGVAGCSLLYHLTRLGWNDVILVEKDELTSGSTWHAAGLCTQFIPSYNLMKLLRYSLELYGSLEAETGRTVDFHRCGSVRLAESQDRLDDFHYRKGIADLLGVPFEIVSPERARELFPLLDLDGVIGAAHLPTDGHVDPSDVTQALARGARSSGAEIFLHTAVTAIERSGGSWLVKTSKGEIHAEIVVNAAGQWARQIGRMVGGRSPDRAPRAPVPGYRADSGTQLPRAGAAGASGRISLLLRSRGGRRVARRPFRAGSRSRGHSTEFPRTSTAVCSHPISTASNPCSRPLPAACPPSRTRASRASSTGPMVIRRMATA